MPHGLLNLAKSPGMTSRDVVNLVQRWARPAKVGHAGTLDPLASGVLVVCVGSATRLIEYVQKMPKRYAGTFLLGRQSPTEDVDGEVTELVDPPVPSLEQMVEKARTLTGTIEQRPPAFSALKVAGRRAYDLARAGQKVELAPRPVTVYRLEVVRYDYPEFQLEIECGSGTYVRSLGRDLALSLNTAAVMSALTRTAIGDFRLDEAIPLGELDKKNWTEHLMPLLDAVPSLPRVELTAESLARIRNGQSIVEPSVNFRESEEFAAVDATGRLVAILARRGPGRLGPTRNFPTDT